MSRPNIIFYFSDQQRADTLGCYGQRLDITPNVDRLAREGVMFRNAFTAQPVCGPCRAMFQTGRYPTELNCWKNGQPLPRDVKTVAGYMEEAGYETAYVGKWHLASGSGGSRTLDYTVKAVPKELRGGYNGYWRAADVLEFTSHGYDGYVFDENNQRIDFQGYRADCINDMALNFLDVRDRSRPFFMVVSQIEPHHQNDHKHYEGPRGSKEKYRDFELPGDLQALKGNANEEYPDYLGQCASLDQNVGRLIARLKEEGLYEDTVIIYASDHGSHFMTRNKDGHMNGGDDYKRTGHDAALKVPLIIRGGSYVGGKVVEDLVSTASLPKTILAMAGIDVGDGMIGENLLDVVQGNAPDRKNEVFAQISESRVGRCIRTPEYLYAVYAPGMNGCEVGASDFYAEDYLYNVNKDPYQLHNVVHEAAYTEMKRDLRARLLAWIKEAEGASPTIADTEVGEQDESR
ncbi:MAG: sulfatase-like hydrolase/transferase [Lachnospiraceae bacterium]|nr:sulfatase-like hydrolase/transferase [Lachnospiraceae bacterium]